MKTQSVRTLLLHLCTIFLIATSQLSCQREISKETGNLPGTTTPNPYTPQSIVATITGRVVDENQKPVSDAQVQIGTQTLRTDVNGEFRANSASVEKYSAFVKVIKDGYFLGSRTFVANESAVNYVTIELLPKQSTGTFSAATGGSVSLSSGGNMVFPANAIVNKTTAASYAGNVTIKTAFIDPTASNFSQIMPGDLRGITTANGERGLQSFGMMAVELVGDANESLQIATGKTVSLTFPIPATLVASAPATIPLWYFDETDGIWKEDGTATKQGNNYVGNVSHFSFWNCDKPFPVVMFDATFKDQNDNPVAFTYVQIKKLTDNTTAYGLTDSTGKVSGLVPANESLQLSVGTQCSGFFTKDIGPFTTATSLGVVKITLPTVVTATIAGSVVNCNNQPVTTGIAQVKIDRKTYAANLVNGQFSINITRCSASVDSAVVTVFDAGTTQQGTKTITGVTSGSFNTGAITACSTSTNPFINFTLDTINYSILPPVDSITISRGSSPAPGYTAISGMRVPGNNFYIKFTLGTDSAVGNVNLLDVQIKNSFKQYNLVQTTPATITDYGPRNGFISGSFNATVADTATNKNIPVQCTFKVKRLF